MLAYGSAEFYQSMPKKRSAVGLMLFNTIGELLIVKPSYKDVWSIVGGMVDDNESPLQAAKREAMEEIGFVPSKLELRSIDYMNALQSGESYQMIFDAGMITSDQIKIDNDEIIDFKFLAVNDALGMVSVNLSKRLNHTYNSHGKFVYLEQGEMV